jgi:hypothetical protein
MGVMDKLPVYQARARECREAAERTAGHERQLYLDLAASWEAMASELKTRRHGQRR